MPLPSSVVENARKYLPLKILASRETIGVKELGTVNDMGRDAVEVAAVVEIATVAEPVATRSGVAAPSFSSTLTSARVIAALPDAVGRNHTETTELAAPSKPFGMMPAKEIVPEAVSLGGDTQKLTGDPPSRMPWTLSMPEGKWMEAWMAFISSPCVL